ncbi:MAG: hypothetical protein KIT00_10770 [Rhodospirillales bacterium]|nr:hypothetical protein [Rhodospirillales bacterium]
MAKFGKFLIFIGFIVFGGAVAWWYLFFEQFFGEDVKQASECFYYTSKVCLIGQHIDFMVDIPAYSPVALWVAAGIFALGVLFLALAPLRN